MKQLIIIFMFLVGISAASSCTSDISEDNKYGSIAGSVSDATTGEPVSTVNVKLSPGGHSTVTGSDGSFSFKNLEPAEYVLEISKEGYKANSAKVTVRSGEPTSAHILIERIPSIVTADRETLDFGDNQSLNTLSFNIVNSSYEDLEWWIEENCDWITEVKPSSGTLKYGKTEGIVVVIDRELLTAGDNKTVIVINSSNGSSQMNVLAVKLEDTLPSLNALAATYNSSTSATLNGEITNRGVPQYTERGFVYSLKPNPTLENTIRKLSCPINGKNEFSYNLTGIENERTYYVRAYAINSLGTAYSSNEVIVNTVNLEWIEIPTSGIAVQRKDLGSGDWFTANELCKNSRIGGFRDWRLPTQAELMVLYTNAGKIGGFNTTKNASYYWSSSLSKEYPNCYYILDFYDGRFYSDRETDQYRVRAVRTLNE